MSYHLRLGHLPFFILHRMAKVGLIPKRLAKLKDCSLHCTLCSFGQAHCFPWRCKKTKDGKPSSIRNDPNNALGVDVSINQMISAQPEFIPQVSGHLTAAHMWAATAFVDHFSWHVYVNLMRDQTQVSTLKAKAACKCDANTFHITVSGYCTDNGHFEGEAFWDEVKSVCKQSHFVELAHTTRTQSLNVS